MPRTVRTALRAPALALLVLVPTAAGAAGERMAALRAVDETLNAAARELDAGRIESAEHGFLEALERTRDWPWPNLALARATDGLADVRRLQQRWTEAETLYREAVALWEALLGPGQPRQAVTLHNLGVVALARGDSAGAEQALRRALALWEDTLGRDSPEASNCRAALERIERARPIEASPGAPTRTIEP